MITSKKITELTAITNITSADQLWFVVANEDNTNNKMNFSSLSSNIMKGSLIGYYDKDLANLQKITDDNTTVLGSIVGKQLYLLIQGFIPSSGNEQCDVTTPLNIKNNDLIIKTPTKNSNNNAAVNIEYLKKSFINYTNDTRTYTRDLSSGTFDVINPYQIEIGPILIECGRIECVGEIATILTNITKPIISFATPTHSSWGDDNDFGIGCFAEFKILSLYYYARKRWDLLGDGNNKVSYIVIGIKE